MKWQCALIERANEELQLLESEHPNKFECLKMELKAFISNYESHNNLMPTCPSAATQESSSRKKRKESGCVFVGSMKRRCNKTDAVLERAQRCLHKIQHFKTSLYY